MGSYCFTSDAARGKLEARISLIRRCILYYNVKKIGFNTSFIHKSSFGGFLLGCHPIEGEGKEATLLASSALPILWLVRFN